MATFNQSLFDSLRQKYDVSLTSTSYLGLAAGDIVVVTYPRKDASNRRGSNLTRLGFIMSSRMASEGLRLSSQLNTLLNFVDVEGISDNDFLDIIDRLYREDLQPEVGEFTYAANGNIAEFKTFNVAEISGTGVFKIILREKPIEQL
jgi:hypothetical protein